MKALALAFLPLLVGVCVSNVTHAEDTPSVAGIRLGMTHDEVKAALRAYEQGLGEKLKTIEVKFEPAMYMRPATPFVSMVDATKPQRGSTPATADIQEDKLEVVLSPPPNQQVIAVGRSTRLAKPVAVTSIVGQLNARHGAGTNQFGYYWWFFDSKSTRTKPPAASLVRGRYCDEMQKYRNFNNRLGAMVQLQGAVVPPNLVDGPDPACGTTLQLYIVDATDPTTTYNVLLIDQKKYLEALHAGNRYVRSINDQLKKKTLEDSKDNKVPGI